MGPRIIVAFAAFLRRRKLYQAGRDEARLGQQEPADLRHMRARGDVDQIVLVLRVEGVGAGEVA